VRRTADGGIALDLSYFDFHEAPGRAVAQARRRAGTSAPCLAGHRPVDGGWPALRDIAASVQRVLEEILVDLARRLQRETGLEDLLPRGGVALNGVANAANPARIRIQQSLRPTRAGRCRMRLGRGALRRSDPFRASARHAPRSSVLGTGGGRRRADAYRREDGLETQRLSESQLLRRVAAELAQGRIVGWMQGACELGPRALGNRSILAAPHEPAMRERLNRSIKYREEFRSIAPAVRSTRRSLFRGSAGWTAGWGATCPASLPCAAMAREARGDHARGRTARLQASIARWRRASMRCSRHTASGPAFPSC